MHRASAWPRLLRACLGVLVVLIATSGAAGAQASAVQRSGPEQQVAGFTRPWPAPGEGLRPAPMPPVFSAGAAASPDSLSDYQRRQGWFSRDKAYHALISAAGAGVLYALGREIGLGKWTSVLGCVAVTGTAGLLREVLSGDPENRLTRRYLSRRDLVWDGIGIAVGIPLADLLLGDRWEAPSGGSDPSAAP